jgi:hypothetical protein
MRLSRFTGQYSQLRALVSGTERLVAIAYKMSHQAPKVYEWLHPGLAAIPANSVPQSTLTPTAPDAFENTRINCILVRDRAFLDSDMSRELVSITACYLQIRQALWHLAC